MKRTKIIYWIITGIFSAFMLFSSIPDIMNSPEAASFITKLGYPGYLVQFLGVAKLLGVIAILIPGYYRVKDWAYAGLAFDLIGATYSFIATNAPPAGITFMLLPMLFLAGSYMYYLKMEREAALNKNNK